jgi:hypothetical protein
MTRIGISVVSVIAICGLTILVIADNRLVSLAEQRVQIATPDHAAVMALDASAGTATAQLDN